MGHKYDLDDLSDEERKIWDEKQERFRDEPPHCQECNCEITVHDPNDRLCFACAMAEHDNDIDNEDREMKRSENQ